jgi:O-antigen/teichoic acid export membrane protein
MTLGSKFFTLSILTNVGMNSDILSISITLGQDAVASSAIPMKIGTLLLTFVGAAFMPLWSIHGSFLAHNKIDSVRKLSLLSASIGALLVLLSGLFLLYIADDFVNLWIGSTFPDLHSILLAMTILAFVVAATAPFNMILNAQGLAEIQIYPWLAFVVIALGGKFLFLSSGRSWLAPAISAAAYSVLLTPTMIHFAYRSLRARRYRLSLACK